MSLLSAAEPAAGQVLNRNNPYSPSPTSKVRGGDIAVVEPTTIQIPVNIAPAKTVERAAPKPPITDRKASEIYRVGVGDVLFIDLTNAQNASGYFTVADDGTINYPLAGEHVVVTGQTSGEIEIRLSSAITLYKNSSVDVKVRDRSSHKITVSGLVEQSGDRTIARDAVPLFVVKAEVNVKMGAETVTIRRSGSVQTFRLADAQTDEVLVYPGDSIEFTAAGSSTKATTGFFYASGDIIEAGQHDLLSGMTLLQAIAKSGGAKGNPKKALIHRKNDKGVLNVLEFNLRSIKEGKSTDPVLLPGDLIEIAN